MGSAVIDGKRLKDRRMELGLSGKEVAKTAKITGAALTQIEKGTTKRLKGDTLIGLAKALKWTTHQVVNDRAAVTQVTIDTKQEKDLVLTYRNLPKRSRDCLMLVASSLLMEATKGPGDFPFVGVEQIKNETETQ